MTGPTPSLPVVTLDQMNELAELMTRADRKYIVEEGLVARLLCDNAHRLAMLEVDGRRQFRYESVYFDTPGLGLYRAAATGRRRRFKVRTRVYADSGLTMLEVKTKDDRGSTVKHRLDYEFDDRQRLTDAAHRFIDECVGESDAARTLVPALVTTYLRSTLVDGAAGTRITIDREVVCTDDRGLAVEFDQVIVETKSTAAASPVDRWLWQQASRPARMSKYCTAMAALRPELPANRWHRTLSRHFAAG